MKSCGNRTWKVNSKVNLSPPKIGASASNGIIGSGNEPVLKAELVINTAEVKRAELVTHKETVKRAELVRSRQQ